MPLFRGLAPEALAPLAAGTTVRHAQRGEVIFNRGEQCDGVHVLVYGQIKLAFVSDTGYEKVVEIVPPGRSFGEAPLFSASPYLMMAQALADSLLLHIDRQAVLAAIERHPQITSKLLIEMANRMHRLISDVEGYSLQSGTERLVSFLLRQQAQPETATGPRTVTLPTSKAIIASRLNVTPEHLSRILHELADAGLIEVEGRVVRILDPERLRQYHGCSQHRVAAGM
jgi:CRP-like cAMP-binding protein